MNVETHLTRSIAWINVRKVVIGVLGVLAILYVAFMLLDHLGTYPERGFDEGSYLKVAKNYVLHGNYADYSSEGDRYTGAIISIGPTVILPVAAAFKFLGISFTMARLVAVGYAVLMILVLYAFCTSLMNALFAVLAVALMLVDPLLDFQSYARTVMGDIPGLFFTLLGLWLWLRPGRRNLGTLIAVGILFGLASMTKTTFAMYILPGVLLALILDRFWYRQRGWLHFIVPGAIAGLMFVGWTYYSLFLIGASVRDVAKDVQLLRTTSNSTLFVFNFEVNRRNFILLTSGKAYLGLFVPALIYGVILSVRRNAEGQRWGTLHLFLIIGFVEFVFSVGFIRYAISTLVLVAPFVAILLYRLSANLPKLLNLPKLFGQDGLERSAVAGILVIGLSWSLLMMPAYTKFLTPAQESNNSLDLLQQYLTNDAPANARIETTEPEVMMLSDQTYHEPSHAVFVNIVRGAGPKETTSNGTIRPYDFHNWGNADYVIVGPWAKQFTVYPPEVLTDYDLVRTFGKYQVYKQREGK